MSLNATTTRVYRVGIHLLIVVGIFSTPLIALGILVAVKKGQWENFGIAVVGAAVFFLALQILRLEIGPTEIKYRNLTGSRKIAFSDISRAYIDAAQTKYAPQGAAEFWIVQQDGGRVKINLRTFSIQAAAALFIALESHNIPIEVSGAWSAQRMATQIRAEQAKIVGK